MRTKTLLAAVAALAAGLSTTFTSQGAVVSANIVGYANITSSQASTYYLMACPFTIGASNGANEVFGTSLPDFTLVLTWDVPSQSYITSQYDSTQPTPGVSWYAIDDFTPVQIPKLPPG